MQMLVLGMMLGVALGPEEVARCLLTSAVSSSDLLPSAEDATRRCTVLEGGRRAMTGGGEGGAVSQRCAEDGKAHFW